MRYINCSKQRESCSSAAIAGMRDENAKSRVKPEKDSIEVHALQFENVFSKIQTLSPCVR